MKQNIFSKLTILTQAILFSLGVCLGTSVLAASPKELCERLNDKLQEDSVIEECNAGLGNGWNSWAAAQQRRWRNDSTASKCMQDANRRAHVLIGRSKQAKEVCECDYGRIRAKSTAWKDIGKSVDRFFTGDADDNVKPSRSARARTRGEDSNSGSGTPSWAPWSTNKECSTHQ